MLATPREYCDYHCSPVYEGIEYMPPQDVNNIPSFINTAEKWTSQVFKCNCLHKYSALVYDIEQYNLPKDDKMNLIYCFAEDCFDCHGTSKMFCHEPCKCSNIEEGEDY